MSDNQSTSGEGVLIGRNHWDVPVSVELRAYLCFGRRMDSQLRRLVTRWAHAASAQSCKATTDFRDTNARRPRR